MSTAPVLVAIDYKLAKSFLPPPRKTDDGAVIVAVDAAALYGAGWVVYQLLNGEKKPAIFRSCTFSNRENRYSQPKAELYGVFRALKHLRHRVWGLHFILEHDAKFLKEMINTPDLPNAPMTRWIQYLQLFDFEMHHVSADHHKAPDGLSRRRSTDADSDNESDDQEHELLIGAVERTVVVDEILGADEVRHLLSALQFKFALQSHMESAPYITYAPIEHRSSPDEPAQRAFITTLDEAEPHSGTYTPPPSQSQPRSWLSYEKPNSIFDKSLLRNMDPDAYCGYEFFDRHVAIEKTDYKCLLGDEIVALPIQYHVSTFKARLKSGESLPEFVQFHEGLVCEVQEGRRWNFEWVECPPEDDLDAIREQIACVGHKFGTKDEDSDVYWAEIQAFLCKEEYPPRCLMDNKEWRRFEKKCSQFFTHDNRLWTCPTKNHQPASLISTSTNAVHP